MRAVSWSWCGERCVTCLCLLNSFKLELLLDLFLLDVVGAGEDALESALCFCQNVCFQGHVSRCLLGTSRRGMRETCEPG